MAPIAKLTNELKRRLSLSDDSAESHATWNVVVLGVVFFFFVCSVNSTGFVLETVINSEAKQRNASVGVHDGYTSLGVMYITFNLANLFVAPVVEFLGAKWSLVLGGVLVALFDVGFFYLNRVYLYFSSFLMGLASALLWTGQGKYLAMNSDEKSATHHASLFWAMCQSSSVLGGLFLYTIFRTETLKVVGAATSATANDTAARHGAIGLAAATTQHSTVIILFIGFTALTLTGTLTAALLRRSSTGKSTQPGPQAASPTTYAYRSKASVLSTDSVLGTSTLQAGASGAPGRKQSWWEEIQLGDDPVRKPSKISAIPNLDIHTIWTQLSLTFKLLASADMLLMVPAFCFSGILLSFWFSVLPTSLAATLRFQHAAHGVAVITNGKTLMALNVLVLGLGQITGGLLISIVSRRRKTSLKRVSIMLFGMLLLLCSFLAILVNLPFDSSLRQTTGGGLLPRTPSIVIALLSGYILGVGECCFYSQIAARLVAVYGGNKGRAAHAFSLFYYFRTLFSCIILFVSKVLTLQWHILALVVWMVLGACGYILAERRYPCRVSIKT